ncbi:MAG: hypothetical protein AAF191_19190 [Verrucomicrobiota bacterium]
MRTGEVGEPRARLPANEVDAAQTRDRGSKDRVADAAHQNEGHEAGVQRTIHELERSRHEVEKIDVMKTALARVLLERLSATVHLARTTPAHTGLIAVVDFVNVALVSNDPARAKGLLAFT